MKIKCPKCNQDHELDSSEIAALLGSIKSARKAASSAKNLAAYNRKRKKKKEPGEAKRQGWADRPRHPYSGAMIDGIDPNDREFC